MTFEQLEQGHGYVLYRKSFKEGVSGTLKVKGLRDYAGVYINGIKAGVLNRCINKYEINVAIPENGILELLVENMGRINYGAEIVHNTKGIISPVMLNDLELSGNWEMYKMPMDEVPVVKGRKVTVGRPGFYESIFDLDQVADTFLDMSGWGKGIVFINGHNLGRYWSIGPQQTLYVPGCWLKKGKNRIVIFEQLNDKPQDCIQFTDTPVLEVL
jgi:hypothetical protein